MRKTTYLLAISLFLLGTFLKAQEKIDLSLKDALQKASENNWQINKAKEEGKAAKAEFRQTNSLFLPNLNFSHTGISTTDPLAAFGFKLKQEITTSADFNPVLLNDPDRIQNFSTKMEVQQPLFNLDGLYQRKAANAKRKAVDLTTERTIHHTHFEVKKAYYRLELAEEAVQVTQKALKLAESVLELTQNNLKQGYVKDADVLSAKVRMLDLQTQLEEMESGRKQANEYLAYLLGMNISQEISASDRLDRKAPLLSSLNSGAEQAVRSDILAYQKGIEARKLMVKSEQMRFLPKLNAFGAYEWNDEQVMGSSAKNYMIGARLSWNLFGGYKNIGKIQKAKADLQIARLDLAEYEARNQMEIEAARRNISISYHKIESSQLTKEQAEEALRIRTNRYKQGLEKTTNLLNSETLAMQKNMQYIQSLYQYHVAIFYLELLLEKDLH
jgi:outer membrane protein TolC